MTTRHLARAALAIACALPAGPAFAVEMPASAPNAATAPLAPHAVDPTAPLYPDYFAAALSHTRLSDDPAWRPLHLTTMAGRAEPRLLVLPVQGQALGFSPSFRAVIGARLDQELERRHLEASRQTDIVDWRGPFVRRIDEGTLHAFAAAHPRQTLLMLYLGHDGDGHAFVTLGKQTGDRTTLAHRRIDIPEKQMDALDRVAATLLPMLAELGLGDARAAAALPPATTSGCSASTWLLEDIPSDAPPDIVACHALALAALMPDFLSLYTAFRYRPATPDQLAWVARAWVEARALADGTPAMRPVLELAALQLMLDPPTNDASGLVDVPDPVVRPLARMLQAHANATHSPLISRESAAEGYVSAGADGMPPFARAALLEHARWLDKFRDVDVCGLSRALQSAHGSDDCKDGTSGTSRATGLASQGQSALLDEWRLASAWKRIYIAGTTQASARELEREIAALPPTLADHPLIRALRALNHSAETTAVGLDAYLAQARSDFEDFATAFATLQRLDVLYRFHQVEAQLVPNARLRDDPVIRRLADDTARLMAVAKLDFWSVLPDRPVRPGGFPTAYLAASPYLAATAPASPASASTAPPAAGIELTASGYGLRPPTMDGEPTLPARADLEKRLAANPSDMAARTQLALISLKHGGSVADARRLVDQRPPLSRSEDGIDEGRDLATAGKMFLFAGLPEVARDYFAKVLEQHTGSEYELHAAALLHQLDGDIRGALEATQADRARYRGEASAYEAATDLFLLGRNADAWALLVPALQTAHAAPLWRAATVGHRAEGRSLAALPDWIAANRVDGAELSARPAAFQWLRTMALIDRRPDDDEIRLLRELPGQPPAQVGADAVLQTAIDLPRLGTPQPDRGVAAWGVDIASFLGFYALDLWNASGGKDPHLETWRQVPIDAEFNHLLGAAMVLAADGQRARALATLTAARFELGRIGSSSPLDDRFDNAPYAFVLASWSMWRQTGERAYAEPGLAIARAYQHVWPAEAWTYAAEALLGTEDPPREVAACRAAKLDPASLMLHESSLHPRADSDTCRRATAW